MAREGRHSCAWGFQRWCTWEKSLAERWKQVRQYLEGSLVYFGTEVPSHCCLWYNLPWIHCSCGFSMARESLGRYKAVWSALNCSITASESTGHKHTRAVLDEQGPEFPSGILLTLWSSCKISALMCATWRISENTVHGYQRMVSGIINFFCCVLTKMIKFPAASVLSKLRSSSGNIIKMILKTEKI